MAKAKTGTRYRVTGDETYFVAPLRRIEMLGLNLWPVMLNDQRTIGFGLTEASAKRIARALNAQPQRPRRKTK